ncbi:MAG TPA: hypothetical protein VJU78_05755 [Chitinophagaceae bacterium]|nr:hypothetical protein [Chitinophagaceae bacterium]
MLYSDIGVDTSVFSRNLFFQRYSEVESSNFQCLWVGAHDQYELNKEQYRQINLIFQEMIREFNSSYLYKDDLVRNYIIQIFHLAMKTEKQHW